MGDSKSRRQHIWRQIEENKIVPAVIAHDGTLQEFKEDDKSSEERVYDELEVLGNGLGSFRNP